MDLVAKTPAAPKCANSFGVAGRLAGSLGVEFASDWAPFEAKRPFTRQRNASWGIVAGRGGKCGE